MTHRLLSPTEQRAVSFLENQEKSLVVLLQRLTAIDSPTGDKHGLERIKSLILEEIKPLRLKSLPTSFPEGNLFLDARPLSGTNSRPGILMSGHLDTVKQHPQQKHGLQDTYLYGRGSADMKGGIAIIISVLKSLHHLGRLDQLGVLFTIDEEIGSPSLEKEAAKLLKGFKFALVFESAGKHPARPNDLSYRSLVTGRSGGGRYQLRVKGKSGHSGRSQPKRRSNAIHELAHKIVKLNELIPNLGKGTTLNVGLVHGGTAFNIIPDQAEIEFDVRVKTMGEQKRLREKLEKITEKNQIPGTASRIRKLMSVPPLIPSQTPLLYPVAKQQGKKLGVTIKEQFRPSGSDANRLQKYIPEVVDGFGPYGSGSHSQRERVFLPSLLVSAQLAVLTILGLIDQR